MKVRRAHCRYGTLSLLGCLLAIAIPIEAAAETCDITAVPPSPVKPRAYAELSAGCTGAPTSIQWGSCLASCDPTAGPVTVCNFPLDGVSVITANAAYSDGIGGSFYASDSYVMNVSSAAMPSCLITANPAGPVQPGAWAEFAANCTGSPQAISWGSSFAACAPLFGSETVCSFPVETNATVAVTAAYQGSFGGCLSVFDTYTMPVQSFAPATCLVTASPRGPVQPGAWADFTAHCSGNPSFIAWSGSFSGFAACDSFFGSSNSCSFPNAGTTVIQARANYGGSFLAADAYAMPVSPLAAPNCNIGMSPQGPLQPGAWADIFARCAGNPTSIQWASSLASCEPLTGAQTVCSFPSPGVATLDVSATYAGCFHVDFVTGDRLPVVISSNAPPTCSISASPASPVRAGEVSHLTANCTGTPTAISWASCFASCQSSTGAAIDCVFPTVGNAPFYVQAAYGGCIGAADTFLMRVNVPLSACTYSVAPLDLPNVGAGGGWHTVTVSTAEGCPLSPTLFQPWIRIVRVVPGTSTVTLTLDVDPNFGPTRATSIVLAGRLFLITQLGQ